MGGVLEVQKVLQVPWTYTLYRGGDRFFLSVLCRSRGGAEYTMHIELSSEEIDACLNEGEQTIEVLARAICDTPSAYQKRDIKGFSKRVVKLD